MKISLKNQDCGTNAQDFVVLAILSACISKNVALNYDWNNFLFNINATKYIDGLIQFKDMNVFI